MRKVSLLFLTAICAVLLISCDHETPDDHGGGGGGGGTTTTLQGIEVSPSSVLLAPGATKRLSVKAIPSDYQLGTITWTSDNPDIVSVDADGIITVSEEALGDVVTITATVEGKTNTCVVTVLDDYDLLNEQGVHTLLYTIDDKNPIAVVIGEDGLPDSLVVWTWYMLGKGLEYSSTEGFIGGGSLLYIPCLVVLDSRYEGSQVKTYMIVLGDYIGVDGPFTAGTDQQSFEKGFCDINKMNSVVFDGADIPEEEFARGAWLFYVSPINGNWYYDAFITGNNFTVDWNEDPAQNPNADLSVMNWDLTIRALLYGEDEITIGDEKSLVNTFFEDWRPVQEEIAQKAIKLNSKEFNKIKAQRANTIKFVPKKRIVR